MNTALRCRPLLTCLFVLLLAVLGLQSAAVAQDSQQFDPFSAGAVLLDYTSRLDSGDVDTQFLAQARSRSVDIATAAGACNVEATAERRRLEARYEPLREIDIEVSGTVMDQRREIRAALDKSISRQSECGGVRDDAIALVEQITEIQTAVAQQFLLNRTDSVIGLAAGLPARLAATPAKLRGAVALDVADGMTPADLLWMLISGGVLAAALGLYLRHRFTVWFEAGGGHAAEPQMKYLFPKPLAQYSPMLLEGIALLLVLFLGIQNANFDLLVVRVAAGVLLFGLGCTVIDWATGPLSPASSIKGLIPDHVPPLRLRLRFFLLTLVASFIVLGTNWLSIRLVDPSVGGRASMIFLVATSLILLLRYIGRIPGLRHQFRAMRHLCTLALFASIVALLLGYQNLAGFVIHGATRTALALIVLWILLWLVYQAFTFLMQNDSPGATRFRRNLGVRKDGSRSGLGFMQLVADLVLWLSFTVYLIYVWDESGTTLDALLNRIEIGYTVGQIQLIPLNIIGGILVFAGVIVLLGWIKRWIDQRWLQHIVAERGAREAVITLIGYVGFILAALIGLTMAGVNLGGLAIVSGALALGIGFGMQEIANNFVSGLILLFERPIRAGDFISVGDTEGFVRRIRIRATEIETQDNQNVLVPNSELVSGRVTNWVLRDPQGRLLVRVGVAYGSDTEKVKQILERVASEHSEVITDGRAPAPRALFMNFGDSSLDFELRVRIQRIERRYTVLSDLNFAIDREFRAEGVDIPFPQRDLRIVSSPKADSAPPAATPQDDDQTIRTRIMHHPEHVTRSLRDDLVLIATPEEVWAAITDIDSITKWLAREGSFRPFIGGPFELTLHDDTQLKGRIDIFLPPRRMRLVLAPREDEEPLASGPITVDFILKDVSTTKEVQTELTVIEAGIPATEDWQMDYRRAEDRWQQAFIELKDYVSRK
ncbi:MAG: mechanosensitive ion channel [Woeseia sp.]